jgi:predicted enzyme related to lactoylglutathione lyase
MTPDPAAAKRFYADVFGWTLEDMPVPGQAHRVYTVIKVDDMPVGGIMGMPPGDEAQAPLWGSYVTVQDVDATAARVAELGGLILLPPTDIPGIGRFCVFRDPQGAVLSAMTYRRS